MQNKKYLLFASFWKHAVEEIEFGIDFVLKHSSSAVETLLNCSFLPEFSGFEISVLVNNVKISFSSKNNTLRKFISKTNNSK